MIGILLLYAICGMFMVSYIQGEYNRRNEEGVTTPGEAEGLPIALLIGFFMWPILLILMFRR